MNEYWKPIITKKSKNKRNKENQLSKWTMVLHVCVMQALNCLALAHFLFFPYKMDEIT